jgi:Flp pilus assembly protein TadG
MKNHYSQHFARPLRQKGIAVVECVIVLPLVLFLILAVAELGNAIQQYNSLTHAARDAARYASKRARGQTGIIELSAAEISIAQNLVSYGDAAGGTAILPGLSPANVTISLVNTENVSVAVAYNYQPIFAPSIPALGGADAVDLSVFTLRTEVIMRVL